MECIKAENNPSLHKLVVFMESWPRLTIFVLGILFLSQVGISEEALSWSCSALGLASLLSKVLLIRRYPDYGKSGLVCFDTIVNVATIAIAVLGIASLISSTDVAWTMVGLNVLMVLRAPLQLKNILTTDDSQQEDIGDEGHVV